MTSLGVRHFENPKSGIGVLVVAVMLASMPPLAWADASADAKAHFHKGADLYREARYQEAITEFQAAYAARPAGVLRFNVAQCYEKLGDVPNAIRAYRDYLRETPTADDRSTVESAIGNMETRLAERGRQALLVYTTPPTAAVVVDGNALGTSPISVELVPGPHQLQVALLGYATISQGIALSKNHLEEVNLVLKPGSSASPAPPPPLAPAPDANLVATSPPPLTAGGLQPAKKHALEPLPEPSHPRLWTWIAAGAAAAALAGGIVEGISAQNNANQLQTSQPGTNRTNLYNSSKSQALTSNILYGTAGVLGAGAVALFFIEGSF